MTRKPPPRPRKRPAEILSIKKPTPKPVRTPAGIATPVMLQCFFRSSDCVDMIPPNSLFLAFYHNKINIGISVH
jgi:hypothetical protein